MAESVPTAKIVRSGNESHKRRTSGSGRSREVVFQRIMAAINKEVRAIIAGKRKSAAIFRWPAWAKPIRIFDRRPKSGVAKTFPRLCSRRKSRDQAGARDE